jgi:DNA-binding transcriptional LysR family regulator
MAELVAGHPVDDVALAVDEQGTLHLRARRHDGVIPQPRPPHRRLPEVLAGRIRGGWPLRTYLRQTGVPELLRPRRSVTYDHLSIALSAAESGHGVALSSGFLCAQRLATGRLRAPFEVRAHSASTYHVVCRPEGLDDPRIVALRDWLVEALSEAERLRPAQPRVRKNRLRCSPPLGSCRP